MIVVTLDTWRKQLSGPVWEEVFGFLEGLRAESPVTEMIPLRGEKMFARIMAYPTRGPEEGVLEAHNKYIDVQMSLANAEAIDWFPRETLREKAPYDAARDVVFFERPAMASAQVVNTPGVASIFFPEDAHMAQQIVGGKVEEVKKVVVKVAVELL